jgi:rubrerythrin
MESWHSVLCARCGFHHKGPNKVCPECRAITTQEDYITELQNLMDALNRQIDFLLDKIDVLEDE